MRTLCAVAALFLLSTVPAFAASPTQSAVLWSTDGRRMLVYFNAQASLFDGAGKKIKDMTLDSAPGEAVLSPDGARLAYTTTARRAWILDLQSGAQVQVFDPGATRKFCRGLKWSADGQRLAFTTVDPGDAPVQGAERQLSAVLVDAAGANKVVLANFTP